MSLRGKSIVLTRPRPQCAELFRELTERGAIVQAAPLIRTEPIHNDNTDLQLADLGHFRWIVFTSTNGVRYFRQRLSSLGLCLPETVSIAVIGSATAAAVTESGWKVSLVPARSDSEGLATAFEEQPLKGVPIALFAAERTRDVLPEALHRQGAEVTMLALYRTVPDPTGTAVLNRICWSETDAVVFMSGSAAEVFATNAPADWPKSGVRLCAVGPATQQRMRELALRVDFVAREPSAKGVIAALEEGLNGRQS